MTPEEFRNEVLPRLISSCETRCLCSSPAFRKLIRFDFRDYGIGPVGLADAEILIDELIRQKMTPTSPSQTHAGVDSQTYTCPRCGAACTVDWEDFSINMARSVARFDGAPTRAPAALYLVGFYGFDADEFAMVTDFEQAMQVEEFLDQFDVV